MKSKKHFTYEEKDFVLMQIKKTNLKYAKKSEIIVTTLENVEKQLIVFAF